MSMNFDVFGVWDMKPATDPDPDIFNGKFTIARKGTKY